MLAKSSESLRKGSPAVTESSPGWPKLERMSGSSSRRVTLMGPSPGSGVGVDQGEEIVFDERDPESVRRAETLIQARFGLSMAGLLTSEPPKSAGLVRRCARAVRAWF